MFSWRNKKNVYLDTLLNNNGFPHVQIKDMIQIQGFRRFFCLFFFLLHHNIQCGYSLILFHLVKAIPTCAHKICFGAKIINIPNGPGCVHIRENVRFCTASLKIYIFHYLRCSKVLN